MQHNTSDAPSVRVELVISHQPLASTASGHNLVRSTLGIEPEQARFRAQSWIKAGYCATLIDQEGKVLWEAQPIRLPARTHHIAEMTQ